jgi:hypothetical protein
VALRAEEILQIKYELGVSVTLIGSEPYITYLAIFDKAIAPYIIDPSTTSTTAVLVPSTGVATPVALTVAAIPNLANTSTPAFTVGTTVQVDVGPLQETPQILVLSGTTIWVSLVLAHGANGAYPVTMAGGETVVRNILARITTLETEMATIAPKTAGVAKVDEIGMYASSPSGSRRGTRDKFESLVAQRETARNDLGEAVGFPNLRTAKRSTGNRVEMY